MVKVGSEVIIWVGQTTYRARTAPPTGEYFLLQAHGVGVEHGDGACAEAEIRVGRKGVGWAFKNVLHAKTATRPVR